MSKKWIAVLSDGTTWELVSPGIRLYSVEEGEVAEVGDRLLELTEREEGIALLPPVGELPGLLAQVAAERCDWRVAAERAVLLMGGAE